SLLRRHTAARARRATLRLHGARSRPRSPAFRAACKVHFNREDHMTHAFWATYVVRFYAFLFLTFYVCRFLFWAMEEPYARRLPLSWFGWGIRVFAAWAVARVLGFF